MVNAIENVMPDNAGAVAERLAWPRRSYAWYVVGLLTVAYGFAILDRVAISLLVEPIKADLRISDTQIGLLQGFAFAICYTTFGLALGFLVDRLSRKWLLGLGIVVWSAATLCCGMATGFTTLFLSRIGVGVGEASVTPASSSLIADYFPPEARSKAYSIFLLGSSIGTAFSSLMASISIVSAIWLHAHATGWIAGLKSWQITFLLVGTPGFFIAALGHFTLREPIRRGRLAISTANRPWTAVYDLLRKEWKAYACLIGGVVINVTAIYASIAWNPTVFVRVHGWSAAKIGTVIAFYNVPLGIVGAVVGGWLTAGLIKRGRGDAPIILAMLHALAVCISGTAMALTQDPVLALGLYAPYCFTSTWSYSAALTGLNQITPNELRGQMTALYTLGTGLVSLTIGSSSVGLLSDSVFHGRAGIADSLAAVFAVSGVAALIALALGRRSFGSAWSRAKIWQAAA